MRHERALVAEEAVAEPTWVPDDRESSVSLVQRVDPVEPAEARRTPVLVGVAAVLVLVLAAGVW